MQNEPQFFVIDKKEFDGYKKIIETQKTSDYEVLTDKNIWPKIILTHLEKISQRKKCGVKMN